MTTMTMMTERIQGDKMRDKDRFKCKQVFRILSQKLVVIIFDGLNRKTGQGERSCECGLSFPNVHGHAHEVD